MKKNEFCYKKNLIISLFVLLCTTPAFALDELKQNAFDLTNSKQQNRSITCIVSDAEGPLIGANVMIKGTNTGSITNIDGKATLDNVPTNATVIVSYIGYITQEINIGNQNEIRILLTEDAQMLDDIVVVGYGTQKKGEITSSVVRVSAKDFNKAPVVNPMQLVEGRVAGLTVSRNGSNPNADPSIQVRGASTLRGDNAPLVIIDGVPGDMRSLNAISPEDIEAIDVLKDGSAAAIYGTRGNNGVIIVTTKRPQVGISNIDYTGYVMHEAIARRPDILNGDEFVAYGKKTNSTVIKDFGARDNAYDLLLNKGNISNVHNLTATGGTEKMNYRASLNYRNNQGVSKHTDRETFNTSIAVNHHALNNRLILSFNLANSYTKANFTPDVFDGDNSDKPRYVAFYEATRKNPTIPIFNKDGSFYENYAGYEDWNPVAYINQRKRETEYKNLLTNFKATYEIAKGLKTSAFIALEKNDQQTNDYQSRLGYGSVKDGYEGRASKSYKKWSNRTFEWTADYLTSIQGVHNIKAMVGYSYQEFDVEWMGMENSKFLTDAFETHNIGAGSYLKEGKGGMSSNKQTSSLIAFFARLNYNYAEKYMASVSLRREGSSKFGENNKWALFPAVSAGWMISKEDFMDDIEFVNMLKFRAGYGVTGSLPVDPYLSLVKLTPRGYYYNPLTETPSWASVYSPSNNPNRDLKWEKNESLNIGFDFSLMRNRLSGSIDWYQRTTKDLISDYTAQQPAAIFNRIMTNVGTLKNQGIELSLNTDWIKSTNFTYTTSFTFAWEKNLLVSLSNKDYKASHENRYNLPSPGNLGYAQRLQEGQPIGSFYGFICDGIDSQGKWILRDLDGKQGLSDLDRTFIGNGLPQFKAGLHNSFTYKNLDFSFFLRGMFDYDVLNEGRIYFGTTTSIDKSGTNVYKYALEEQLKEDPIFSSYYLERGDFLKIDNVTLGYTFNIHKNSPVRSMRVYANITNLATITGYKGLTPDINVTGLEAGIERRGSYPVTRTFMFGVNLGF